MEGRSAVDPVSTKLRPIAALEPVLAGRGGQMGQGQVMNTAGSPDASPHVASADASDGDVPPIGGCVIVGYGRSSSGQGTTCGCSARQRVQAGRSPQVDPQSVIGRLPSTLGPRDRWASGLRISRERPPHGPTKVCTYAQSWRSRATRRDGAVPGSRSLHVERWTGSVARVLGATSRTITQLPWPLGRS